VRLIGESRKKDDRLDAQRLARLARIDPELLYPVKQRRAQAQADLSVIRARAGLVAGGNGAGQHGPRTGEVLRRETAWLQRAQPESGEAERLSPELQAALEPLLNAIESLSERIVEYNQRIENLAQQSYPQVALLKQIQGVGTLIALTYLLTLEDPHRFCKSRDVGCYLGLQPGRRNSGESEPQLAQHAYAGLALIDRLETMKAQPLGQFASIDLVTLVALFEQCDLAWVADQKLGHMRLEQVVEPSRPGAFFEGHKQATA
jgi:transposase